MKMILHYQSLNPNPFKASIRIAFNFLIILNTAHNLHAVLLREILQ